eukprot:4025822-Amphidinium_carterae.1
MKRPFDHPRDMPTHIGMFPLSFQKELFDYYDASIAHMCARPEDHTKLNDFFAMVDIDHGTPDDLLIPNQVK